MRTVTEHTERAVLAGGNIRMTRNNNEDKRHGNAVRTITETDLVTREDGMRKTTGEQTTGAADVEIIQMKRMTGLTVEEESAREKIRASATDGEAIRHMHMAGGPKRRTEKADGEGMRIPAGVEIENAHAMM